MVLAKVMSWVHGAGLLAIRMCLFEVDDKVVADAIWFSVDDHTKIGSINVAH